jgi:hypothetical protein
MKKTLSYLLVCVFAFSQMSFVDEAPSTRKFVGKAPPQSKGDRWRGYAIAAIAVAAGITALVIVSSNHNDNHHRHHGHHGHHGKHNH